MVRRPSQTRHDRSLARWHNWLHFAHILEFSAVNIHLSDLLMPQTCELSIKRALKTFAFLSYVLIFMEKVVFIWRNPYCSMIYGVWATIPSGSHLPYRKALCITASLQTACYMYSIFICQMQLRLSFSAATTSVNKSELLSACGSIVCGDLGAATFYCGSKSGITEDFYFLLLLFFPPIKIKSTHFLLFLQCVSNDFFKKKRN